MYNVRKASDARSNRMIYENYCGLLEKFADDLHNVAKALNDFQIAVVQCRKRYNI
ncbi:MAG: hypothetical protein A4E55_00270 [Pelotomaculum sp. PtaU1.Bin035]|nr:MAG: hypothetical protein A4E55_00270 [Pelotomaculum sp. PtaU1.Bin035]